MKIAHGCSLLQLRAQGRIATGQKAMALAKGASLVGMSVLPADLAAPEEVRCCLTIPVLK